jgi:predicted ribosome quality control (RQC) complex YloA/Tae2 family protein
LTDNFFVLNEISLFLKKEITGYSIKEIFTQEKDRIVIHFTSGVKDIYTEFSCSDIYPYITLKYDFRKAKKNVMNLMPGLYGQKITETGIFNNDRIIRICTDGGIDLYFVFFKSKRNLFAAVGGKIIDAFQNKKEYSGTSIDNYISRKEEQPGKQCNTVKEYFRSKYRQFGDLVLKEFLFLQNTGVNDTAGEEIKSKIDSFMTEYSEKLKSPLYLLYRNSKNHFLSLVKLEHLKDFEAVELKDINELIQAYLRAYYKKHSGEDLLKKAVIQKENQLRAAEKKLISLNKQIEVAGNAEQLRVYGDMILANMHKIKKGDEKIVLSGEEYPGQIDISLKRELSPSENATLYFDKYKRQKNSIELLKEKTEVQKRVIENLRIELEEIRKSKDIKSLKMDEKEIQKNDETSKFRKFRLSDKFEVWVGRDSASNDLLTMRYSAQNDLWFHVRGASGSHTVLKISDKKNPPEKKIIETAASIAAYYSKARNASNIPVAYCERKYVKKKKGFREGSVVMEREKVIFVKPGLPENEI